MDDAWTLVFSEPEPIGANPSRRDRLLYWILRRLKPGFRHVFAMRRAASGDGWLIVNWHSGRLDVIETAGPIRVGKQTFADYGAFVGAMEAAGLATTLAVAARPGETWHPRGIATCVTAIKHLLAVPVPRAQTPWSLYRHLAGGKPPPGGRHE